MYDSNFWARNTWTSFVSQHVRFRALGRKYVWNLEIYLLSDSVILCETAKIRFVVIWKTTQTHAQCRFSAACFSCVIPSYCPDTFSHPVFKIHKIWKQCVIHITHSSHQVRSAYLIYVYLISYPVFAIGCGTKSRQHRKKERSVTRCGIRRATETIAFLRKLGFSFRYVPYTEGNLSVFKRFLKTIS